MIYSGLQPQYFPRLHYFARILAADIFVIRDDAQFVRKHKYPDGKVGKSYQADTPIKQSFGQQFLTIPIKHAGYLPLEKTLISYDQRWVEDHLKTLRTAYARAKNFSIISPEIASLLALRYQTVATLTTATILWAILRIVGNTHVRTHDLTIPYVCDVLKKHTAFRLRAIKQSSKSKAIRQNKKLTANEKIVALCKEYGATVDYCGGTGVAAYVDHKLFEKNGITIKVQDWKCKPYRQLFMKQQGFIPNLSIIDLLMNVSQNEVVTILKG